MADRLGERLEQPVRGRFDDLADRLVDLPVVDRLLEVVVDAGRLQVEHELDVDLERLGREQLVVVVAVATLEAHVGQDDPVAHGCLLRWPRRHVPRTTASLIRAARTLAWTSWTRTMSAPPAMPSAVVASVPPAAGRRAGPGRDRGSTCGSSRAGSAGRAGAAPRARAAARGCGRRVLPNPKPGSTMRSSHATPETQGAFDGALEVRDELGQEPRVARLGAVVHDDERDAVVGGEAGQRVVLADPPHVVDEVGAGGEGGLGDGRLGRVDAQRRVGQRRPQCRDDRHDPAAFLVLGDRVVPGPRRFATDVEDVGALLDHPAAGRDRHFDRVAAPARQQPVAGERIGRHVEDAHHERALAPGEDPRADPVVPSPASPASRHPVRPPHGSGSRRSGSSTSWPRAIPTR